MPNIIRTSILGIDERLTDRVVLSTTSDITGTYYIHTPTSLQSYRQNRIDATISLPSYNQNQGLVENEDYFLIIDKSNCISVISKNGFKLKPQICIPEISNFEIAEVFSSADYFRVLYSNGEDHMLKGFDVRGDTLQVIKHVSFRFQGQIRNIVNNTADRLVIIDDQDKVHFIGYNIPFYETSVAIFDKEFSPRFQEMKGSNDLYFSMGKHEGICV